MSSSKVSAAASEQAAVQAMRDLAKLPENCRCADCDARDPDWTSINLGIFICIKCAGIHRNLGVHHSKVRSIELDTNCWDEEMIAHMCAHGNARAKRLYENRAPVFYVRPKEYDLAMVRERWIRAKYEKRLFVKPEDAAALDKGLEPPTTSTAEAEKPASNGNSDCSSNGATADAKAASNGKVEEAVANPAADDDEPPPPPPPADDEPADDSSAAASSASSSAASSSPAAPAPAPAAASGSALPANAESDPACFVVPERSLEGWLYKENKAKKWQKRWFLLWGRELHYFKESGDSYEAGRIDVVHCKILIPDNSGSSAVVSAASGAGASGSPAGHRYLFDLVSTEQDRAYPLAAESEEEMFDWIHAIRRAIIFYTSIAQGDEQKGMQARQADCKVPFSRLADVSKKGFLNKQGGGWASWNKRFFVLAKEAGGDTLYYFKSAPADADLPEGGICLEGADVSSASEDKLKKKLVVSVITPDRTYFIQATSEAELSEWLTTLRRITDLAHKRRMVDFADPKLQE